jgi:amino acid adenylation domain-containing protein
VLLQPLTDWRDIPPLDLPTDSPRTAGGRPLAWSSPELLHAPLATSILQLSEERNVHPRSIFFTAYCVLLHRYTRQHQFAVGTAGQDGHGNVSFERTAPVCVEASPSSQFGELLDTIEAELTKLDAVARDATEADEPPIMFAYRQPTEGRPVGEVSATGDLALIVDSSNRGLEFAIGYDPLLFEPATIERMHGHLRTLLGAAIADPSRLVAELPLLTSEERDQMLVDWNATERSFLHCRADELIATSAGMTPDKVAVETDSQRLTYHELEILANQLAWTLQGVGVGPNMLVGICLERSANMVVALLAVMKAGGAYVPIDPAFPPDRQQFMLQDSEARVLLTQESLLDDLPSHGADVIVLDRDADIIAAAPHQPPPCAATPEDLAYVIYTSGSTGRPKGVEIPHRALVNFLTTMADRPGFGATDTLVAVTTLSFDIAGLELYLPLATGARLVLASRETATDPRHLAGLIARSRATIVQATPSTWRMLVEAGWEGQNGLKALCGGEALPTVLAEQLVELGLELWNMYGPTETTIWSTIRPIANANRDLTIGRPIGNTRIFILDERLEPVPVGIPGELHIGGKGVARGYLKRPELTMERFIRDPFSSATDARIYKTGDLARYRANGEIEFLGRLDHQVKVLGYRIELGEIETCLARHPSVLAAAVTTREESPGDVRLVGYVIPSGAVTSRELRRYLGETLPSYMIPASIVALDAFPLTPNGKIDRNALPAPTREREVSPEYVAPRTPLEKRLTAIWEEVLELRPIGVTDDFFDLGASSLVAAQLFARIEHELAANLPLAPVFQAPTIEALARLLDEGDETPQRTSLVPIQPKGTKPPFFCVHGGAGTILHLQPLARRLGVDQPFYGLQARGLYGRVPPLHTIESMSQHYLDELRTVQPHGPYYLGGYCFGAIVAFDMAQRLRREGEQVAFLVTMNGPSPSWVRKYRWIGGQPSRRAERAREPAFQPRRSKSRRILGVITNPRKILGWARFLNRWASWVSTDILDRARFALATKLNHPLPERLRERYFLRLSSIAEDAYHPENYPDRLFVFYGEGLYDDPELGWRKHVAGLTTFAVPGSHETNRDAMTDTNVGFIADQLESLLAEARALGQASVAEPSSAR